MVQGFSGCNTIRGFRVWLILTYYLCICASVFSLKEYRLFMASLFCTKLRKFHNYMY
ncbi:hypothetical protein BDB01DRAFT_807116 [Pilobolus umbonatus]|nr:hypothetical protein BDB01DRAFT_807029 [Pilobolus umbonatus]KAI8974344.1 hypothetical protein BDB01DRAFT_807116 [Pilobolus umbonatus]